jgi:hypothetical protein
VTRWIRIAGLLVYLLLLTLMTSAQDIPALQMGLPYQGTASNATRIEHRLTLNAGDVITIVLNSSDFDPVLQIEQGGQVWLMIDDVGASTNVAVSDYRVPTAGDYILAVSAFADRPFSGSYTLLVAQGDTRTPYEVHCPMALPSPFAINSVAEIPIDGTERQIYADPSITSEKVTRIPVGTAITLLEGPVCEEGVLWWWIQFGDTSGWVIESGYGEYWIVPLTLRTNPVLLTNGVGRSNNQAVSNGEFQVEYYCRQIGYNGTGEDGEDWFCTNGNGQRQYTLEQSDFDVICQETYNREDAFALQNGANPTPAFRWLCYAPGQ